mgnify:FL=1
MSKKVIYVGHRGTKLGIGVENTLDAYIEAAKLGYQAIETDIRVTLDKEYICCHDENLIRLTRNSKKQTAVNVQECHFKDIKDLELTEITNGVKRIGKICTFDEYLSVCKEYNCIPIIELKWTNGIYSSNDNFDNANYSNLDGLIKKVYEHGLAETAVIMTSMIGCLLYVKEKYPNIKLQWLCNLRTKEFMAFVGEKGIDLDVQYLILDEEVLENAKKYNQLINIWTLDDETLLNKYLDMSVDMVTTNYISPRK